MDTTIAVPHLVILCVRTDDDVKVSSLLKVLNTLPPSLSFVLVQRKIRTRLVSFWVKERTMDKQIYAVLTAGAVMTGLFL